MNFSPDNRTTLETLLSGLNSGVSGEMAAPILSATLQAQMQQNEQRKARYQEMATNVANMAGQGLTYGATSNYVDAMTPKAGIPGKFQQLMDAAYANPDIPEQIMHNQYTTGLEAPQNNPELMAQLQSPLYTQNPASVGAYNANIANAQGLPNPAYGNLMTAPGQARYAATQAAMASAPAPPKTTNADMMGAVNAQINKMRGAQMSPEEIAQAISTNPQVQGTIMDNLNEFIALQPDVVQAMGVGV